MFGARPLTSGEMAMMVAMFGSNSGYSRARIIPRNYWWPYPNDRAMTPHGDIFFPKEDHQVDYSDAKVSLPRRALFMHEATHLYQWYVLKQWVFARGPFDRNYRYELVPGKSFQTYGLEQMGQIVQDYYTIKHGGKVAGVNYRAADYEKILPVTAK